MDTNAAKQTVEKLKPGAFVLINFGLGSMNTRNKQSVSSLLLTYTANLRELLRPGYYAEVQLAKTEDDEATLVVSGQFAEDVCQTDRFWYMLKLAGQDCAAIYYPHSNVGVLFGDRAEQWEPFELDMFKKPNITVPVSH